ncbi:MAG TPA: DOMON-like domain-containing protein [Allosphingosinicella sp.]|nr:DOMON-like domain-containing protein [Allosphingosinicella sp.]
MRLSLQPHPDTPCGPLTGIQVELTRTRPLKLRLRYVLLGDVRKVRLRLREPARGDGLWRHTCFEAFVRLGGDEEYLEFNLAPSGDWAAYRFLRYREGMAPAKGTAVSHLGTQYRAGPLDGEARARLKESGIDTLERFEPAFFTLETELSFPNEMGLAVARPWNIGLSTIVEERNGRMSYWALAHPPGKPDFHDPACFALELPAARI